MSTRVYKTLGDVLAGARNVKFTVKLIEEDEPYILVEGDKASFKFLSDLFDAHARDEGCGFQLAPNGPGSAFFKRGSRLGLYLHRLPCINKKLSKQHPPR